MQRLVHEFVSVSKTGVGKNNERFFGDCTHFAAVL
jgi:hypothetical protein